MQYLTAFLCGGLLCAIGQIFIDKTKLTPARILTGYVVTGVFLEAIGAYAPIAECGGDLRRPGRPGVPPRGKALTPEPRGLRPFPAPAGAAVPRPPGRLLAP